MRDADRRRERKTMNESQYTRDRYEREAQRLWKRWLRAARYALKTTVVDAMLRFRLGSRLEVSNAVRDMQAGPRGWVYMLQRARRVVRLRCRQEVEMLVLGWRIRCRPRDGARSQGRCGAPGSRSAPRPCAGCSDAWGCGRHGLERASGCSQGDGVVRRPAARRRWTVVLWPAVSGT